MTTTAVRDTAIKPPADTMKAQMEQQAERAIEQFSMRTNGTLPTDETILMAKEIARESQERTAKQEFCVDEDDGSLAFMIGLKSGLLMMGEISIDGTISGGTYDTDTPSSTPAAQTLRNATPQQLTNLF